MPELLRGEGPAHDEQEGDEAADDVEAVEAGGHVEGGAVSVGRQGYMLGNEHGVFHGLAGYEEGTHDEREGEPFGHAPTRELQEPTGAARLESLGGEDAHLASKGTCHKDDGVDERKREVELGRLLGPHRSGCGAQGEVHGKEAGEEHQLTGQPNNGSNRNQVGAVQRRVRRGTGGMGRRCHKDIMSVKVQTSQCKPPIRETFSTKTRIRAEKFPASFTLVIGVAGSIASGSDFSGIGTCSQ